MIRQDGTGGSGLDLLAVQRDDELLDLLGSRRAMSDDDEVARLLAALAADVDHALPAAARPTASTTTAPAQVAEALGHARRLGAAGVAAAVLLGGSVALSGAAAAVTGDPLAPYRTVGQAVGTVGDAVGTAVGQALSFGDDDLPEQAAPIAHLNKRLAGARAALAHGHTTEVRALVDELTAVLATADLSDEQRAALQQRLDKLEDSLARATSTTAERGRSSDRATAAATPVPRDGTESDRTGGDGSGERAPRPTGTREPVQQDKPADKEPADKLSDDVEPDDAEPDAAAPDDAAPDDAEPDDKAPPTAPQPQPTTRPGGGGRGGASPQSTELDGGATEQRGQGASRR